MDWQQEAEGHGAKDERVSTSTNRINREPKETGNLKIEERAGEEIWTKFRLEKIIIE